MNYTLARHLACKLCDTNYHHSVTDITQNIDASTCNEHQGCNISCSTSSLIYCRFGNSFCSSNSDVLKSVHSYHAQTMKLWSIKWMNVLDFFAMVLSGQVKCWYLHSDIRMCIGVTFSGTKSLSTCLWEIGLDLWAALYTVNRSRNVAKRSS